MAGIPGVPSHVFDLKDVDRGWDEIKRNVRALKQGGSYVKAGILGPAAKEPVEGEALDMVGLAAVHEFGSKDGTIPERSWIRSTFELNRAAYVGLLRAMMGKVLEGKLSVEKALNILGMRMAADMKKRVTTGTGIPPPNAPATFARKLRQGERNLRGKKRKVEGPVMSPRTLVDTGRMVGSVTHVVVLQDSEAFGGGNG